MAIAACVDQGCASILPIDMKQSWIDEERISRDPVLMVKIRTAIDEERCNLGMAFTACLHECCASTLSIDNNRHQRRDVGGSNHEWIDEWKEEDQETLS